MFLLIPKVDADTRGTGMLEVVCKVVESVTNTPIKSVVQFHDVLHGFCAGRRAGDAIMELKLVHQMASVDQDLPFIIFLYLSKAYNNLD